MINTGEDDYKYGKCPWCEQEKMLTWVMGKVKGKDQLWAGYVCNACLKKAKEEESK